MPSIFTHVAVPLAIGIGLGKPTVSRRLMAAGVLASIMPDFDVIGLKLGVEYASEFGHRGFSHSLLMAVFVGWLALLAHRHLKASRLMAFVFIAFSMLSHGLLDMMTTGKYGVALLWPWSSERLFFDFRPIRVSPIGSRFFTERGMQTLVSEFYTAWLPALSLVLLLWAGRFGVRKLRKN